MNIGVDYTRKRMALQLTRHSLLCRMTRQFYRNGDNKIKLMSTNIPKSDSDAVHNIGTHMYTVTNFDKRILVWVKRYPSMAEVPTQVTRDCMLSAKSKARVRTCNIMMVFSLLGFILAAFSGKRDVAAGKSLFNQRQEWYKGLQEEREAELAAAAAAAADNK